MDVDVRYLYLYSGVIGGIGLSASVLTWWVTSKKILPSINKLKIKPKQILKTDSDNWVAKWIAEMEPRLKKARFGITADRLFLIVFIGAIISFIAGVYFLKNIMAALCLSALTALIPDQLILTRIENRRYRMNEQLSPVINLFYSELAITRNPQMALDAVANRTPEPLGGVMRKVVWLLGTRSATPDQAFAELADQLDFEYGRLFAQTLREIWDGKKIQNMLPRMANKCAAYQRMVRKTKTQLLWFRITGNIMNVLTVPVFIAEMLFMDEARQFLVNTTAGKLVVVICCMSILVGTLLNRILSKVEY